MITNEDLDALFKDHIAKEDVRFDKLEKLLVPAAANAEDAITKIKHAAAEALDLISKDKTDAKAVVVQAAADSLARVTAASALQSKDIEFIRASSTRVEAKVDQFIDRSTPITLHNLLEKRIDELEVSHNKRDEAIEKNIAENMTKKEEFSLWRGILITAFGGTLVILIGIITTIATRKL